MKSALLNASRLASLAAGMALVAVVAGCDGRRETREVLNMPDMHFSPSVKAQEPNPYSATGTMALPPAGAIAMNEEPYTIADADADKLASKLPNPLTPTAEILKTGEKYYNIHCVICHGAKGDGMGNVPKANAGMPMPPSLYSDKVAKDWTDGRIFHVITRGQGNMPGYGYRIDAENRWAVIHYVRSLQRAALGDKKPAATTAAAETTHSAASKPAAN